MQDLTFRCACGELQGTVAKFSASAGIRAICYCNDCQCFARFLGGGERLDAHGGSEVFALPPGSISLQRDASLALMQLSPKGLHRWYCKECNTAFGNSTSRRVPFVGVSAKLLLADDAERERQLGPLRAALFTKHAYGADAPRADFGMARTMLFGSVKAMGWLVRGLGGHFLYQPSGAPIRAATVLSAAQRQELLSAKPS